MLSLLFAVGGTAIAAKRFLITRTNQISPKVLNALKPIVFQASTNNSADPLVLSLDVPAGSYTVVAKAVGASDPGKTSAAGGAECVLSAPGASDASVNSIAANAVAAFSNALAFKFGGKGTFTYRCDGSGGTPPNRGFFQARIVATQVRQIRSG